MRKRKRLPTNPLLSVARGGQCNRFRAAVPLWGNVTLKVFVPKIELERYKG